MKIKADATRSVNLFSILRSELQKVKVALVMELTCNSLTVHLLNTSLDSEKIVINFYQLCVFIGNALRNRFIFGQHRIYNENEKRNRVTLTVRVRDRRT